MRLVVVTLFKGIDGGAILRSENVHIQTPVDKLIGDYLAAATARRRKPMRLLTADNVKLLLKNAYGRHALPEPRASRSRLSTHG